VTRTQKIEFKSGKRTRRVTSRSFPETSCYATYINGIQCDILDFYIKNRVSYQTQISDIVMYLRKRVSDPPDERNRLEHVHASTSLIFSLLNIAFL